MENNASQLSKWAFIGKNSMTFAQIIFTVALGSQFFKDFTRPWRLALSTGIITLIVFAIIVYPNSRKAEK